MSELNSPVPAHAPNRGSLWPLAAVVMLVVFGPTLLAWALSLLQAH